MNSKAKECAEEIASWLAKKNLQRDVSIYVNGKRYHVNESGKLTVDLESADPKEYFEYAGDFLSMSFEGPLYNVLNYLDDELARGYDEKRITEFTKIIKKYGKYYELGNAWNLSLYDI